MREPETPIDCLLDIWLKDVFSNPEQPIAISYEIGGLHNMSTSIIVRGAGRGRSTPGEGAAHAKAAQPMKGAAYANAQPLPHS